MKDRFSPALFLESILPYIYFIGIMVYWFYDALAGKQGLNFLPIIGIGILVLQVKLRNNIFGFFLGLALILFSLSIFLATISEYSDFQVISDKAKQLLITGSALSGIGFIMAILVIAYHIKKLNVNLKHDI